MKKYNLSVIMKDAHRIYNSKSNRRGRSWAECLKAAWGWEKDAVKAREERAARLEATIAASWAAHNERMANRKDESEMFAGMTPEAVSLAMGYGRGSGSYCGD